VRDMLHEMNHDRPATFLDREQAVGAEENRSARPLAAERRRGTMRLAREVNRDVLGNAVGHALSSRV
jgi:hypothetical protein